MTRIVIGPNDGPYININFSNYDYPHEERPIVNEIVFTEGIQADDIQFSRQYIGDGLTVAFSGLELSLSVSNFFKEDGGRGVEILRFADGTVLTAEAMILMQAATSAGEPELEGGEGNDVLTGGKWADTIKGLKGDDEIKGGDGNDYLTGGEGSDVLFGGPGHDFLQGSEGDDILDGGEGYDVLSGGAGNDVLRHCPVMNGGDGDDEYWYALGDGNARINTGETDSSNDVLKFAAGISLDDLRVNYKDGTFHSFTVVSSNKKIGFYKAPPSVIEFSNGDRFSISSLAEQKGVFSAEVKGSHIKGTEYQDIINGNIGNDQLYGEAGNDSLTGGAGDDEIDGGAGDDKIVGGAGDDKIVGGEGNDEIDGGPGNDSLHGGPHSDIIRGGEGNDIIDGDWGDDKLFGDAGNDFFVRNDGGNFYYSGGPGNDTYEIEIIDEDLRVNNYDEDVNSHDVINLYQLDIEYIFDHFKVKTVGNDLVLSSYSDNLTIENYFLGDEYKIDEIRLLELYDSIGVDFEPATEIVLAADEIESLINGTNNANRDNDNLLRGNDFSNTIDAGGGNDIVGGFLGDDTLLGGAGDDHLFGHEGNDTLNGGDGDNRLFGGDGNDILLSGSGFNFMIGGRGDDTYAIDAGSGDVVINPYINPYTNHDDSSTSNDVIRFEGGLTENDLSFRSDEKNLIITINSTGSNVRVDNFLALYNTYNPVIMFSDGTSLNASQVVIKTRTTTTGDDVYHGSSGKDIVDGLAGNDFIYGDGEPKLGGDDDELSGGAGNDFIDGGPGDDLIKGGPGNDILKAGSGSDQLFGDEGADTLYANGSGVTTNLEGGRGSDVYIVSDRYGRVFINNSSSDLAQRDILRFDEKVSFRDITLDKEGDSLVINHKSGGSMVEVVNFYQGGTHELSAIEFSDGPRWDTQKIKQLATLSGSEGNDSIVGSNSDDEIASLGGDDHINSAQGHDFVQGGDGNDHLFGGDGNDNLYGNAGDDLLEGVTGNDYLFGGIGNDTLRGSDGDDHLYGGDGDDVLSDGLGNSYFAGGEGNDVYVYQLGNGHLEIANYESLDNQNGVARNDTLKLEGGINFGDVTFAREVDDLRISIRQTGEVIVVRLHFATPENALTVIEFSDGERLDLATLDSTIPASQALSTENADVIQGSSQPDFVKARGGDDTISGGAGNDSLYGQSGNDSFIGGVGDDKLVGGSGVDTVAYSGDQKQFSLRLSAHKIELVDRTGVEGVDTLESIEKINFGSGVSTSLANVIGVMDVSQDDLNVFIEMYIAYFNRAPDAEGLYYWGSRLADGMPLSDIAKSFFDQEESKALYPNATDQSSFIHSVYNNFLGREADQAGFEYWLNDLNSGNISRDTFMLTVINGAKAADGSAADAEYIGNKAKLGAYYSVIKGMSNSDNAKAVMALFDGTDDSLRTAKVSIDNYYNVASDAQNGELLIQLVGVIDDPFMV